MALSDNELALVVRAVDNASATLNKVKGEVKDYSNEVSRSMGDAAKKTADHSETSRKVLTGVGVAMVGAGAAVTAFAKNATDSTLEYVGSVKKLSRETGIGSDRMSELIYAFKRTGLDAGEASASLGLFSKKIVENNQKTGEAALKQAELENKMQATRLEIKKLTDEQAKNGDKSGEIANKIQGLNIKLQGYQKELKDTAGPLDQLGVKTQNADGSTRSFDKILFDVADKFKAMPAGAEKTAAAMELFGRKGKDLLPILDKGSEGIETLMKRAKDLGLSITPENISQVTAYVQAQKDLVDSVDALKIKIGLETIPVIADFNGWLADTLNKALALPEPLHGLTLGFLAFGGPVTAGAGAAVGFGANLVQIWPDLVGTEEKIGLITRTGGLMATFLTSPIAPVVFLAVGIATIATMYDKITTELIPALIELKHYLDDAKARSIALKDEAERAVASGNRAAASIAIARQYKHDFNVENLGPGYRTSKRDAAGNFTNPDGMASGGSISAGTPYWVGEEGPELVVPKSSGTVIPHDRSVGGVTLNQVNNIYNPFDLEAANRELGWRLANA